MTWRNGLGSLPNRKKVRIIPVGSIELSKEGNTQYQWHVLSEVELRA